MLPEVGHFALILALCFSFALALLPLIGTYRPAFSPWISLIKPLCWGQGVFVAISYLTLTYAFYVSDFSVAYVAHNSHQSLAWYYRISAVWGSHEGSMLLWLLFLMGWICLFVTRERSLSPTLFARTASILGAVGGAINAFILLTSNPFARWLINTPQEGADLNPLLQDIGFIFHPPILYLGYVGLVIPFALAIAVMLASQLEPERMEVARSWAKGAWLFLTLGITLGSWWAYYELGWGGWWFWDPVENAALMPWLIGGALVHAMMVASQRKIFYRWVLLLAVCAFAFSLLGTFLVRSGVLSSVHSFAADPKRGIYLLHILVIFTGMGLFLFARTKGEGQRKGGFHLLSKETLLMSNNVLLFGSATVILLGTLYPLILEWGLDKTISVGPPYFNAAVLPLWLPLLLLVGGAPYFFWQKTQWRRILSRAWPPIFLSVFIGGLEGFWVGVGAWVVLATLWSAIIRAKSLSPRRWQRKYWGMLVAHIGIGLCVLGGALTTTYSTEKDVRMRPGEIITISDYVFYFKGLQTYDDPHSEHMQASIEVSKESGSWMTTLTPEKQFFKARRQVMTETAIDAGFWRDIYVALGDQREDGSWTMRIYLKPFVRWLWLGGVLMALGIGLSIGNNRKKGTTT